MHCVSLVPEQPVLPSEDCVCMIVSSKQGNNQLPHFLCSIHACSCYLLLCLHFTYMHLSPLSLFAWSGCMVKMPLQLLLLWYHSQERQRTWGQRSFFLSGTEAEAVVRRSTNNTIVTVNMVCFKPGHTVTCCCTHASARPRSSQMYDAVLH